jgi:hypothetical protein
MTGARRGAALGGAFEIDRLTETSAVTRPASVAEKIEEHL